MTAAVIGLVLLAALLHASWNALLRSGRDRMQTMVILNTACAVIGAVALPFLGTPAVASWGCIAASALLHVGYNLFLVRAYQLGDLAEAYPIARGSSPLLVALGAALFAGERLGIVTLVGVLLVSGGIMALALRGGRIHARSLPPALATGLFIASYTVVDGIGGRLSGDPGAYAAWLFVCEGFPMTALLLVQRGASALRCPPAEAAKAALGGLFSILAYAVVIWAMTLGPMGAVSALRETSVLFAALIGRLFLAEPLTLRRVAACCVIALGAACLGWRP